MNIFSVSQVQGLVTCIYENRYIILQKDYCLLRSPAILKYVIRNTVGMRNVLTFTGSECLTACIF